MSRKVAPSVADCFQKSAAFDHRKGAPSGMKTIANASIAILLSLLLVTPLGLPVRFSYGAQAPTTTSPWTQEKVTPKEVQDREKASDLPVAWCTKQKKNGDNETSATYADGTEVKHIPGKSWVIIIPGPKGKTKITYDEVNRTKT